MIYKRGAQIAGWKLNVHSPRLGLTTPLLIAGAPLEPSKPNNTSIKHNHSGGPKTTLHTLLTNKESGSPNTRLSGIVVVIGSHSFATLQRNACGAGSVRRQHRPTRFY